MKKIFVIFIFTLPFLTGCVQTKMFPSDVSGNVEPINQSQVIENE